VEAKGEAHTYYSKVRVDSPSWCGTINYYVQYLVPPCWLGSPNIVVNGPASCPDWCKYVSNTVKEPACQPLYNGKGGCPGWPPASLLQVNEEHARAWLAEVAEESARNGTTPKAGVVPARMPTAAELAQAEEEPGATHCLKALFGSGFARSKRIHSKAFGTDNEGDQLPSRMSRQG